MNTKKKGTKNEKATAKKYDGKLRPNSGAIWVAKGDVVTTENIGDYRGLFIQDKTTEKKSFSIRYIDVKETIDQALEEDRMPIFRINYEGRDSVIVIPEWLFEELLERMKDGKEE